MQNEYEVISWEEFEKTPAPGHTHVMARRTEDIGVVTQFSIRPICGPRKRPAVDPVSQRAGPGKNQHRAGGPERPARFENFRPSAGTGGEQWLSGSMIQS